MAEIRAANWAKNEFEVRYPPMSSIAYRLRTNPPFSAGKTVAPTTSPVLYRCPHRGQGRGRETRNSRKTKTRSTRGGCMTVYTASFFRFRPTARPRWGCSWYPSPRSSGEPPERPHRPRRGWTCPWPCRIVPRIIGAESRLDGGVSRRLRSAAAGRSWRVGVSGRRYPHAVSAGMPRQRGRGGRSFAKAKGRVAIIEGVTG